MQLITLQAVAGNVLDALGELRQSRPNDPVLLFVSGHGFKGLDPSGFAPE